MSAQTIYITVTTISIKNQEHSMYVCHFIHLRSQVTDAQKLPWQWAPAVTWEPFVDTA